MEPYLELILGESNMEIKILMIDDDEAICKQIKELFDDQIINNNKIKLDYLHNFEEGINLLKEKDYDLIILDLYKGRPSEQNTDRPGEQILEHIKKSAFIPVIFFSGLVNPIQHLKSEVIRIVRKSDGNEVLKKEIESVFESKLPLIRKKFNNYVTETMRSYFWDFVHPNWSSLKEVNDEVSLGYLLIRRLANSLSKDQIGKLLGDPKIKVDKSYPMEFYIYPPMCSEYETGDILKKDDSFFVLLTPSCDLVNRNGRIKAQNTMLVKTTHLEDTEEYKTFKQNNNNENKKSLMKLIESRKSDRYFFLPKTTFITNSILDFQDIIVIPTSELNRYTKIAKVDSPFAESMLSNFIRYYNRVGFPDIDSDHIIDNFD